MADGSLHALRVAHIPVLGAPRLGIYSGRTPRRPVDLDAPGVGDQQTAHERRGTSDTRFARGSVPTWRLVLPPILTLVLLLFAFLLGLRGPQSRSDLPVIAATWLGVMVITFFVADVGDDDDVGAFFFSALVVLLLAYMLWRLGAWLRRRRA